MPHPDDRAFALWFGLGGLAILAGALWLALRGATRRQALRLEERALVVEHLRPKRPELTIDKSRIVALHHGGLGDRHPVIRVEHALDWRQPAPGHVDQTREKTRMVALPRGGFEMHDPAILATLRQWLEADGAALTEVSGVPVFGRHTWRVDHSAAT